MHLNHEKPARFHLNKGTWEKALQSEKSVQAVQGDTELSDRNGKQKIQQNARSEYRVEYQEIQLQR